MASSSSIPSPFRTSPASLQSPPSVNRTGSSTQPPTKTKACSVTPELSHSNVTKTRATPTTAVHVVTINYGGKTLFNPSYLDDIPVGDAILFESHGDYKVFESTLSQPCAGKSDNASEYHLLSVDTTEPLWFFACPEEGLCHCNQTSLFALNPGNRLGEFYKNAPTMTITFSTLTTWIKPITTYTSIKVVYPTDDSKHWWVSTVQNLSHLSLIPCPTPGREMTTTARMAGLNIA